jgi:Flp pilus assembly protein TadD
MANQKPNINQANPAAHRTVAGICLCLAVITLAVFGQTVRYHFINYDDNEYVSQNPVVDDGLTLPGLKQALVHGSFDNWDPLTTLTHMADCQFYGLWAGGHHLTNVLLHTATVILLFLVLRQMTGATWRSAFVAAVFAIHPLRAESVAWVSERKDVLSGLFFMLTLWAYGRYVRRPKWLPGYLLVLLFFALGLMSKVMLVTLPLVLLLLDYWPLQRVSGFKFQVSGSSTLNAKPGTRSFGWLILEKLPMLVLVAVVCGKTLAIQGRYIQPIEAGLRLGNAVVSYVTYLEQMIWPAGLAVFYPHPASLAAQSIWLAGLVLALITAGVFIWGKKRPYLWVGWLWYVGMLVPVIGIIQVGAQAHADRYTYLPQIGVYFALTWLAVDLCGGWRHGRLVLGSFAVAVLLALGVAAFIQTTCWYDSEVLWRQTIAHTSNNSLAYKSLGDALLSKGRLDEAIGQFQTALEIKPQYADAHNNLGFVLNRKGQVDDAITHYRQALEIKPNFADADYNLGVALGRQGRVDEAIEQYRKATALRPGFMEARKDLGVDLIQKGEIDEGVLQFEKVLEARSNDTETLNNLAWVLATSPESSVRNGTKAVVLAEQANHLSGDKNPELIDTLAAAYAEAGRFPEAMSAANHALQLAVNQSNASLTEALRTQISFYQAGLPFRDVPSTNAPAH